MIDRLKLPILALSFLGLSYWIGSGIFNYFTHVLPPVITINGIHPERSYARTAECSISADTAYKVQEVTVNLDGKPFFVKRVKAKQFDAPFAIDTTTLADGPHTLDIEAVDSSYHNNKTQVKVPFFVDNTPLRAVFEAQDYVVDQGKTLHMKIQANKQLDNACVAFLGNTYSFYPDSDGSMLYKCFIPIDCEEQPQDVMLTVDVEDKVQNKTKLNCHVKIKPFEFKKQRGFSVSTEKIDQEKELSISMKVLEDALTKWLEESPNKKLWTGPFEHPIQVQKITTPHGEIRVTPERGRYMHKGVDLINRPKCVVWASQTGKVIIKDRYIFTGNTVVIDHGIGVFSLYAHLEDFADLEIGDMLKKGSPVGKLGMTGYATGYHLHYEIMVNKVRVDPLEWTNKVF